MIKYPYLRVKLTAIFLVVFAILSYPFLFFAASQKKKSQKNTPLRILVIPVLTRIGDLVCATPVFEAIKMKYPDSYLAVVVSGKISQIIQGNPYLDEIILYKTSGISETISAIRKGNFLWSFNLIGTSVGTALSVLGLIPNRVKTLREDSSISERLTDWMNPFPLLYRHHTHLPTHYLDLLQFIDIYGVNGKKNVFMTKEGDEKARLFFKENNLSDKDFLVGMSITTGNKIKEWGDGNFYSIAEKLSEIHKAKIIFIGSRGDAERIGKLAARNPDFIGAFDFSLSDLPSLMNRLNLFIAADTGPIYIAHALGVPLIDIIGPVDPHEQPPEDNISILVKPAPGIEPSSFVLKRPGKTKDHKRALESITVEKVLGAVQQMMKRLGR